MLIEIKSSQKYSIKIHRQNRKKLKIHGGESQKPKAMQMKDLWWTEKWKSNIYSGKDQRFTLIKIRHSQTGKLMIHDQL